MRTRTAVTGGTAVLAAVALAAVTACSSSSSSSSASPGASAASSSSNPLSQGGASGTVVVGSANFPESELLAEVYAQALQAKGIKVTTKLNIGSREVYYPQIEKGTISIFPEYNGNLQSVTPPELKRPEDDCRPEVVQAENKTEDDKVEDHSSALASPYRAARMRPEDEGRSGRRVVIGGPHRC